MPSYFPPTLPYAKLHGKKHAAQSYKNTYKYMISMPTTLLNANNRTSTTNMHSIAARRIGILDLPLELQKEIFKHSPTTDLISLSLVSKAFHEIAAANLYREFHIIFPDEEDVSYESPIDGLASCLDTFVTSDYNYSKFLRSIDFDTLVGGDKAERAYRQYTYDNSCGKFLNTLFLLTLKKATALEKFKWNIRVELSRPVFEALHRITALKHLHLRLHAGPSLYESPPPLTSLLGDAWSGPGGDQSAALAAIGSIPAPPSTFSAAFASLQSSYISWPTGFAPPASSGVIMSSESKSAKSKYFKARKPKKIPSTFSGFRDLQTLCILDMDTLEYLSEIQECIRNSSSTLHKLKLSFSESLANKSRKQVVENDDEESDADEPFPPSPQPPIVIPGPPTVRGIEDEKKAQESVLAQIFGFEPSEIAEAEESAAEGGETCSLTASKNFIEDVRYHLSRLLTAVHGPGSRGNLQKEVMDAIEKATQKVTQIDSDLEKAAAEATPNEESSAADSTSDPSNPTPAEATTNGESTESALGLFDSTYAKKDASPNDSHPEDVDIEAPEGGETNDWEADGPVEDDEPVAEPSDVPKQNGTSPSQPSEVDEVEDQEIEAALKTMREYRQNARQSEMRQYIRDTRGLALHTLEVYLIPIKASVLSRAIDFKVLTRITLLNVGAQSPFWTLLQKENKSSPLPLTKISTDNVTLPFLTLVSELKCVTELFMLERSTTRQKVESSAPKTTVTKEQIRTLVLRKHAKNLRKLMIKNESDYSWDMSEKSILLLCKKGKNLEELAICCGIKTVHALFQNIHGLQNLHALHIISFRAEDTCVFVISELRKFAVDIISCYPSLKIEYIGIMSTLSKITRTIKKPDPASKSKGKGKAKAAAYNPTAFSLVGDGAMSSSEDEDEEGEEGVESGVKLEISEAIRFCEVQAVRIFREDVRLGRL